MGVAEAQTIHWITFIDTNDKNVGKIDVLGREVLYSHFVNEVNAALAPMGYSSDIQDFYGDKVTPENCKAAVELLRINTPDDIIVFYYIGHGGRPVTDMDYMMKHPYPQMCMQLKFPESKYIPLEWVYQELSSKGARLSVTIGMCCNSLSNISIKEGPTFSPNYGATYMSGNKLSRIQELFLGMKGNVLATSASPTQTSGCFKSGFGVIDSYTTVLCDIFNSSLDSYSNTLTWDELLETISSIIDENTDRKQTPIHETHLTAASAPKKTTSTTENVAATKRQQTPNTTKTQAKGDGEDWVSSMSNILSTLVNVNVDENKRINMERELGTLFAPNAKIHILSQDAKNSLVKEDADVFLGRLATSRLLLNVTVIEGTFDTNNRISSMKVREIYLLAELNL